METIMQYLARTACVMTIAAGWLSPAHAAPFCIQNQLLPPQCMFYDAKQCADEAQRQNAQCSPNPAEIRLSRGTGEYCVVTSSGASVCAYADYQTCTTAATQQHGACVQADPSRTPREPNPYSAVNGE
jgi:hypothetical protein